MEDHNITESQITASSLQNGATNARLNFKPTNLLATGAWCAAPDDTSQPWLQIDFQDKVTLSQVAIQGRFYDGSAVSSSFFHWVEKYSLNYSLDGMYFKAYKQFDDVKIFQGNWDSNTVVFNSITPVIYTRYIRILPKSWEGNPCIRAEFFTCHKEITLEKVNVTSSVASSTGVGLQWKPPDTLKLGEHKALTTRLTRP
ncbi:EGF-like repeat and discoidin I-like domain-containing protein 3 [Pocillopora verrucosa]|uniref:EGF-like repeat and discoidin I-like domain-containing protein 3 n=1 Tax=Pocillopora verrucosa TaxID=203993 RepID=UPI00333F2EEF